MIIGGGYRAIKYALGASKQGGFRHMLHTVFSKNTCKACAYGTGGQRGGMRDENGNFPEICKKSFQAHSSDLQKAIPPEFFKNHSIDELRQLPLKSIDRLGRLNSVLYKEMQDSHYRTINWNEAFEIIVKRFRQTAPERSFFYNSGRSSNEAGFLLQLFARLYGSNNISNSSYYCHQASGVGISSCIGTGTATVLLMDLEHADLIFVIGANPASNHPRFMRQLVNCRRRSGKVVVVNPVKESGLVKFALPSDFKSMISGGSDIASEYLQIKAGGDIALMKGIAKAVLALGKQNLQFVQKHTNGYSDYLSDLNATKWDDIELSTGISRKQIEKTAEIYSAANNVIFSWAVGVTHHEHGVENVESIVNLALLRGMIGKQHAGLLPLRGHSNVQGIGSVGVTPALKDIVKENLEKQLNITLPESAGNDTMSSMTAAHQGKIDLAVLLGGNLYSSNPDSQFAEKALGSVPFKIYMTTTLNRGHFTAVDGETLILPAAARDEEEQQTTQESMFNYVRLSDGGIPRFDNVKTETEIICTIAERVIDINTTDFSLFRDHSNIRKLIGKTIPGYEMMQSIDETKQEFQISGRTYHSPQFATKDGKADFRVCSIPLNNNDGRFTMITARSEGQFNNIVYEDSDIYRGQNSRNVVMMSREDIARIGLQENAKVKLQSETGCMDNMVLRVLDIAPGHILTYFPEANEIIPAKTDPRSKTPVFKNVKVEVVPY